MSDFFKNLPASETKPLSGATTLTAGAGYPAELVAYSLLDDVTSAIGTAVEQERVDHVLIVEDRALLDSDWSYLVVTAQLQQLKDRLSTALAQVNPPLTREAGLEGAQTGKEELAATSVAGSVIGVAGSMIGAMPKIAGEAADVVGMLRTNYTMASRTMSPSGTPLVAQVANTLKRVTSAKVSIDGFAPAPEDSPLVTAFEELQTDRQRLAEASAEVRVRHEGFTAQIADLEADRTSTLASLLKVLESDQAGEKLSARLDRLDRKLAQARADAAPAAALVAQADAVLAAVDAFVKAALTPGDGDRSPLLSALAREGLHQPGTGPSHVLFVSMDSVGADLALPESRTRNTEYVRYLGGMQVSFLLLSVTQRGVVASGVKRRLKQATLTLEDGRITENATAELT